MEMSNTILNGPDAGKAIVLAHGAGLPMDAEFMQYFAESLASRGFFVLRFEFPYMAATREDGKRRPPNPANVLLETFRSVAENVRRPIVLAGKSMGGRIASMLADELQAEALVCLGYPFHPVGKPDRLRIDHLQTIQTPTLICQGDRDPFGNRQQVDAYDLSSTINVHWVPDGDHSFVPRKSSGRDTAQNWAEAVDAIVGFLQR